MLIAIVTGNVGNDAEVKATSGGDVCHFDVASNKWTRAKGEETTWVRCSVWGERGKRLAEHLRKGARVTAVGEVQVTLVNGKVRHDLRVDSLDFVSPRKPGDDAGPEGA